MSIARMALAALVLAGGSASASAQQIGRLFHSPGERAALDSLRKAKSQPPKPAAPKASAQSAQIDGYVLRPDGKSTLWVNGSAVSSAR